MAKPSAWLEEPAQPVPYRRAPAREQGRGRVVREARRELEVGVRACLKTAGAAIVQGRQRLKPSGYQRLTPVRG